MKKYTLAIFSIALFLGSHIVSMDRNFSPEGIRAFKYFLASNLAAEQEHLLYYRPESIPMLTTAILINWTQQIRDIIQDYRINLETAEAIFVSLVKEAIIQNLSSHFPNETAQNLQLFYNTAYRQQIEHLASRIFKKLR